MIYQKLADYYDALVYDEAAIQEWIAFVKRHASGKTVLDLACGSGDIALHLADEGYDVDACDLSDAMLKHAMQKDVHHRVNWYKGDMRSIKEINHYDIITCFCDSVNYLMNEEDLKQLFHGVKKALHEKGMFLFDIHTLDRLVEFKDEFLEEGSVLDAQYEWSIQSDDDLLYQNFVFFDSLGHRDMEQHIQRVYDPQYIISLLKAFGFHSTCYTDFHIEGINAGEKIFFASSKGGEV